MSENLTVTTSNFWEFYLANRSCLDTIINTWARYLAQGFELEEIRQEILIRMNANKVLERFDSSKSAIKTYFNTIVIGYIRHHVDGAKNPLWRPFPNGQNFPDGEQHRYVQSFCQDINGIPDEDSYPTEELSAQESLEENLSFQAELRVIKKALDSRPNDHLWDIFSMLLDGWTMAEIAKKFTVSSVAVRFRRTKIKAIIRGLMNAGILDKIAAKAATFSRGLQEVNDPF